MVDCLDRLALAVYPAEVEHLRDRFDVLVDAEAPGFAAALNADECFLWLYNALATSSVVVVPLVGSITTRKIVKLSFDETIVPVRATVLERLGWLPYRLLIDLPFIGAGTFHFQVQAPSGMQIVESYLVAEDDEVAEADVGLKRRVHLYVPEANQHRAAVAYVFMRVRGAGFVGGAVVAAAAVAGTLLFCTLDIENISRSTTSAPALLLVLPGALATYASRAGEHALTTRLLSVARRLLIMSAGLAFIAAGAVATHVPKTPPGIVRPVLIVCTALAAAVLWGLWETRRLPLPSDRRRPLAVKTIQWHLLYEYDDGTPASSSDARLFTAASTR